MGYSNEFIKKYVYDSQSNQVKTLLPVNEKYLELKARKGVDFGCEVYNGPSTLVARASRLRDFQFADELTMYLLRISDYRNDYTLYLDSIQGTISVGNLELADKIIQIYRHMHFIGKAYIDYIISGVYENGDISLLDRFKINMSDIDTFFITRGLAARGSLEDLKKMISIYDSTLIEAIRHNRENIIDYYDIRTNAQYFNEIAITAGNINLISDINKMPVHKRNAVLSNLIKGGYLEEIEKYRDLLTPANATELIVRCIDMNHLDMFHYIYELFPREVKESVQVIFHSYGYYSLLTMTDITIKFLYENNIITKAQLKTMPQKYIESMEKAHNTDGVNYVLRFKT